MTAAANEAAASVDRAINASDTSYSGSTAVPEGFRVLSEGKANMLFPVDDNAVFYNNAQIFNRDLSVMVARLFLEDKRKSEEDKMAAKKERRAAEAAKAVAAGKPVPSYDGPPPPAHNTTPTRTSSAPRARQSRLPHRRCLSPYAATSTTALSPSSPLPPLLQGRPRSAAHASWTRSQRPACGRCGMQRSCRISR